MVHRPVHRDFARAMALHRRELGSSKAARDEWDSVLKTIAAGRPTGVLDRVNRAINAFAYKNDEISDGAGDQWEAPVRFILRGGGDCEDYALAKYAALREMGVAAGDMSVVISNKRGSRRPKRSGPRFRTHRLYRK